MTGEALGTGFVVLIAGDDYLSADGRQLQFIDSAERWPSLGSGSFAASGTFNAFGFNVALFNGDRSGSTVNSSVVWEVWNGLPDDPKLRLPAIVESTTEPQEVAVEVPRAEGQRLAPGGYRYDLLATLGDGHVVSLNRGYLVVLGQTAGQLSEYPQGVAV